MKLLVPVVLGLITAGSVLADPLPVVPTPTPASAAPIHFEQVNGVVSTILKEVIALETPNGDNYSFITPYFDPARSSLENESLAYSTEASVKNAPWSSGVGTLQIDVDTFLKTDRVSPITGIGATMNSTVTLDVLEVARYAAKKMIAFPITYDADFKAREQDIVNRMSSLTTLADFNQLIADSRALALDLIDRDTLRSMARLDCLSQLTCGNVVQDQWGNPLMDEPAYLYEQIRTRELVQTKSIALGNSTLFDGTTISLTMNPQAFLADNHTLGNYQTSLITFAAGSVKISASGFAQVKAERLDRLHQDFAHELGLAEIDDSVKHARLQQAGRDILVSFRRIMAGQIPSAITVPFDSENQY